jgi:TetR/AcrR family transcriptional regulator, transcriptional repressor for nem operon
LDISYTEWYICRMKFQPRSEKTRQFIIENTADVFNKKGYAGTSLTDLTEATKLTKGSIYGNFENKEEVAAAVLDYNINRRKAIVAAAVEQVSTWKEKLLVYASIYSSKTKNLFPAGGCPYLNCGTEADDTNETLRKRVADGLLEWKQSLTHIITGGVDSGEFRRETDVTKTAISLIAIIEGGIFLSSVMKTSSYLDAACQTATELVLAICN